MMNNRIAHRQLILLALCFLLPLLSQARLVDPTRPAGYTTKRILSPEQLRLSSVIIGKHSRTAVINGKRVAVGDEAFDMTVQSIAPTQVVLSSQRRGKFTVKLISEGRQAVQKKPLNRSS